MEERQKGQALRTDRRGFKMKELQDYSGEFNPDIKYEDFSKDILIKLLDEYANAYLLIDGLWNTEVTRRYGETESLGTDTMIWMQIADMVYPRVAKLLNIGGNDVVDILKVWQCGPDGFLHGFYLVDLDIKNRNHVIFTVTHCGQLLYFEKHAPEKIPSVCYRIEPMIMNTDFQVFNPYITLKPLKLSPRKSPDEVPCQWEIKLNKPDGDDAFEPFRPRSKTQGKTEELQDYSVDFDPEMKFEDFSKEFIVKLLHEYARSFVLIDGLWSTAITQKHGDTVARDCDLAVWFRTEEIIYPRIAKILNVQVKNVLDVLKTWQLAPDGYKQDYYDIELDIKNSNHVIWTTKRCGMLSYFERKAPEKITSVCHDMEQPIMQKIFDIFNPDMRVKALKLPPRESPDEIACQFEYKLEPKRRT